MTYDPLRFPDPATMSRADLLLAKDAEVSPHDLEAWEFKDRATRELEHRRAKEAPKEPEPGELTGATRKKSNKDEQDGGRCLMANCENPIRTGDDIYCPICERWVMRSAKEDKE